MTHTFTAYTDDDTEFKVQYCYRAAEPMTWHHPGADADVEITAVDFGRGWEDPDIYPQINLDELIDKAHEDQAAEREQRACERGEYLRNEAMDHRFSTVAGSL